MLSSVTGLSTAPLRALYAALCAEADSNTGLISRERFASALLRSVISVVGMDRDQQQDFGGKHYLHCLLRLRRLRRPRPVIMAARLTDKSMLQVRARSLSCNNCVCCDVCRLEVASVFALFFSVLCA
jgi:hypothetical protein